MNTTALGRCCEKYVFNTQTKKIIRGRLRHSAGVC
jgi:hypothetical protein